MPLTTIYKDHVSTLRNQNGVIHSGHLGTFPAHKQYCPTSKQAVPAIGDPQRSMSLYGAIGDTHRAQCTHRLTQRTERHALAALRRLNTWTGHALAALSRHDPTRPACPRHTT
jgi:hypothetical protein